MRRIVTSLITVIALVSCMFTTSANATEATPDHAPSAYGATEVTLKVTDSYTPTSPLVRPYARDLEDGDITQHITTTGTHPATEDGKLTTAGDYTLHHCVTDSDGHTITWDTVIHVLASDSTEQRSLIRKVYNNASAWNTQLQGVLRADNHERQPIGLTLPTNGTATVSVLSGGVKLAFSALTNNQTTDSKGSDGKGAGMTIASGATSVVTGSTSQSAPLLVQTPMNTKAEGTTDKNIQIKVTWDNATLTPYFYQGDDQDAFLADWDKSGQLGDQYALIEGTRSLSLARNDLDRNNLFKLFPTLTQSMQYHADIFDRYDQLIGLSSRATDPLDYLVRSKGLFRADAYYAGKGLGAVYAGGFIAVCNTAIWPLFDKGWGLLHEIGHGYQGSLGKEGSFKGGETSNNVLGYYAQHNKDILDVQKVGWYLAWDKTSDEKRVNVKCRLSADTASPDKDDKGLWYLYTAILDALGQSPYADQSTRDSNGYEPLASVYHWYRAYVNSGKSISNESAFLFAAADNWGVNLLPFYDQWNISVPDWVRKKIGDRPDLDNMVIVQDALGVNSDGSATDQALSDAVLADLGVSAFSIVRSSALNSTLKRLNETRNGTLQVTLNGAKDGTSVHVLNNGTTMAILRVKNGKAEGTLPVGAYQVQAPYQDNSGYPTTQAVQINPDATTTIEFKYGSTTTPLMSSSFELLGKPFKTLAASVSVNPQTGTLDVKFAGSRTGCGDSAANGKDCAVITVTDKDGNIKKTSSGDNADWHLPYGTQHFTDITSGKNNPVISADIGDKVSVSWYLWNNSGFSRFLDEDGNSQPDNVMTDVTTEYIVTAAGLVRSDRDQEQYVQQKAKEVLQAEQSTFDATQLANRRQKVNRRAELLAWASYLSQQDREELSEFIEAIHDGSRPVITLSATSATVEQSQEFDPLSMIANASDLEDGDLTDQVTFSEVDSDTGASSISTEKPRNTTIKYAVTDSDGNTTTQTLALSITAKTNPDDAKKDDTQEDTKPDDSKKDDTQDDTKPDDTQQDDTQDDTKPDDTKSDETKPGDTQKEDTKDDTQGDTKSDDIQDDTEPDDTQKDEAKPDDAQGDAKPDSNTSSNGTGSDANTVTDQPTQKHATSLSSTGLAIGILVGIGVLFAGAAAIFKLASKRRTRH